MQSPKNNQSGFSLMEVIMTVFILLVLILGVYELILVSLKLTGNNKMYVEAVEISNQKMERIRNMAYSEVGVSGGVPNGTIPQEEMINRNGIFTVNTYIAFYDDPYDGTLASSTDAIGNDYKIATIKVSWQDREEVKSITVFSKIVPRTEETADGYGLLKLHVIDSNSSPVAGADIRIVNTALGIDVTNPLGPTDASGILYFIAPESIENYRISVTKTDYGTDQTYDSAAGLTPIHLSVTEGNKTEESFSIDRLATVSLVTYSNNMSPNWMVNQATSTTAKTVPRAGADGVGNLYFAWNDLGATSSTVLVQKYDAADGRQWASDLKISDTTFQLNPDIVTAASGNSYVVWQDNSVTLKQTAQGNTEHRLADTRRPDASNHPTKSPKLLSLYKKLKDSIFQTREKINHLLTQAGQLARGLPQNLKVNQLQAQEAGAIVQTKMSSNATLSNTMTATFNSPPTAGNVIIAVAMRRNSGTFLTPYNAAGNFTQTVYSNSSWYMDIGIWHKVVGVGEPSQVTIESSSWVYGGVLYIMEVSNLDTSNLVDVVSINDQTGNSSNTAHTGSTAVSEENGFAVAAFGFADDNFNTANSSRYSSASGDNWTHLAWDDWWSGRDGTLSVAYLNVTAAAAQRSTLSLTGAGGEERNSVLAVFRVSSPDSITVSASGNQTAGLMIPSTEQYVGGKFVFKDDTSNHNITDITISESGTVDALNSLSNVKLFYDFDTTAPYDCASEQYDAGLDSQFGASANFDAANGSVTFSEVSGLEINTSKSLCTYVVLDIGASAVKDQTLKLQISNPPLDIISDAGTVQPSAPLELADSTTLLKPADLQQKHYRFREDDGDETDASWKSFLDNPVEMRIGDPVRLRFAITNKGSLASAPTEFRLEYGDKITTCDAIALWHALPSDNSLHWKMHNSIHLSDASPTTDSADLPNDNIIFIPGEIKDTSNQTAAITLSATDYTELEYSVIATANATDKTYCFRLTDAGAVDGMTHEVYPEATIIGDYNIYIKSIDSSGNSLWGTKKVNASLSGADQVNPRLAITENFGSATTTVFWEDNQNGNKDIYGQAFDAAGNKLWGAELQITASSTDEHSLAVTIDPNDHIIISWINSGDVYLQKFDLAGNQLWTEHKNISTSPETDFSPALATDASANIYLTWTKDNASVYDIYLAKFDTNGLQQWVVPANLEESDKNQYLSQVAVDDTYAYLIWSDTRKGNNDIFTQKFDHNGNAIWSGDQKLNDNSSATDQSAPNIAINALGETYAAWVDERNGPSNIYAVEFSDPTAQVLRPNMPLVVTGTKRISNTPLIYEYDRTHTTDANGLAIVQFEWDKDPGYTITASSTLTTLTVVQCDPACPFEVAPGEIKTIKVYVE